MVFCRKNRSLGVSRIVLLVVIAFLALLLPETDWLDSPPPVEDVLDDFYVRFSSTRRSPSGDSWNCGASVPESAAAGVQHAKRRRTGVVGVFAVTMDRTSNSRSRDEWSQKAELFDKALELFCSHLLGLPPDSYQRFLPTSPKVIPTA